MKRPPTQEVERPSSVDRSLHANTMMTHCFPPCNAALVVRNLTFVPPCFATVRLLPMMLMAYTACIDNPATCRVRDLGGGDFENDCCDNRDCVNANGPSGDDQTGNDFKCQLTGTIVWMVHECSSRDHRGAEVALEAAPRDTGLVSRSCSSGWS